MTHEKYCCYFCFDVAYKACTSKCYRDPTVLLRFWAIWLRNGEQRRRKAPAEAEPQDGGKLRCLTCHLQMQQLSEKSVARIKERLNFIHVVQNEDRIE